MNAVPAKGNCRTSTKVLVQNVPGFLVKGTAMMIDVRDNVYERGIAATRGDDDGRDRKEGELDKAKMGSQHGEVGRGCTPITHTNGRASQREVGPFEGGGPV